MRTERQTREQLAAGQYLRIADRRPDTDGRYLVVVADRPTVALATPAAGRATEATIATRLAVCRACPKLLSGDRCGVLVERGKGAAIMGGQGIPNPVARCPDNPARW